MVEMKALAEVIHIYANYEGKNYYFGHVKYSHGEIRCFPASGEIHYSLPLDGHAHISTNDNRKRMFGIEKILTKIGIIRRKSSVALPSEMRKLTLDVRNNSSSGSIFIYKDTISSLEEVKAIEPTSVTLNITEEGGYSLSMYKMKTGKFPTYTLAELDYRITTQYNDEIIGFDIYHKKVNKSFKTPSIYTTLD